jgi:chromosome segregation protein
VGIVNLVAIEELQELEERHAFLEKQHGDLTQAKDQLLQAIRKINSTMREMFSETFEKVRVNFKVTFTKLFNGGKADIVLMDDSNDILGGQT